MYNNDIIKNIEKKLEKGEEISPFLFIGQNLEIINSKIKNLAFEALKYFNTPNVFLYVFEDNSENIKVKEIRDFTKRADIKTNHPLQIFFIENISRLTIASSNSLLKFLEEPGVGNIIFLSNIGENNILETVLSRVQKIYIGGKKIKSDSLFYKELLKNYLENNDTEIISYFFRNKLEKGEYINFLEELINYIKNNLNLVKYLDEILEDLNMIEKNNLNPRFIVDKWIFKIS